MTLPRSIQQQADAAKQHFESLQNPEPSAPEPDKKTPDAPDTATQSADTEPKPEEAKRSQDDEPKRSDTYWENRFRVLQGKYDKEVPALSEEVRKLTQTLEQKDRQITELESSSDQSTNPGGLTDEQMAQFKEEFGEDFVSFVQRMVSSSTGKPDNSAEVNELKRKVESFERKEQQKTEASFWAALNELVPDWKSVNASDKFRAFLAGFDPQTGSQRQQSLSAAQQALDADGVAAVFNTFKKQQSQKPNQGIPDDQVDPPTSRSTTEPKGAKIWTGPEIKQFYADKTAGKYRNNPDEAKRLEADIFAAQREGRVR